MTTTLFRLQQFASLRRLRIAGLVAVLLVASGNAAYGQASKKSPPASNNAIRPASSPRVAANDSPDPKPETQAAPMTIERVNELTGFEPASEAEVKLLVEKMQSAVSNRDKAEFLKCFDHQLTFARSVVEIPLLGPAIEAVRSADQPCDICEPFASSAVLRRNHFGLVSIKRTNGEFRPLFRLVSEDSHLDYAEFVVQRNRQDGPKIVDAISRTGEYYSLNGRDMYLSAAKLLGAKTAETELLNPETMEGLECWRSAWKLQQAGLPGEALKKLDQCPDPVRTDLSLMMCKCVWARLISDDEFIDRVKELIESHPGTYPVNILQLKVARITRQEADQMEIAERLMKSFDDPFLHYYRVKGLVKAGRLDEARQAMDAAKRAAPTFVDVHVADVELLLIEGDHDRTMKAIESVESTFGDDVLNLASYEGFEDFSQSPIGRKFLAQRAGFEF